MLLVQSASFLVMSSSQARWLIIVLADYSLGVGFRFLRFTWLNRLLAENQGLDGWLLLLQCSLQQRIWVRNGWFWYILDFVCQVGIRTVYLALLNCHLNVFETLAFLLYLGLDFSFWSPVLIFLFFRFHGFRCFAQDLCFFTLLFFGAAWFWGFLAKIRLYFDIDFWNWIGLDIWWFRFCLRGRFLWFLRCLEAAFILDLVREQLGFTTSSSRRLLHRRCLLFRRFRMRAWPRFFIHDGLLARVFTLFFFVIGESRGVRLSIRMNLRVDVPMVFLNRQRSGIHLLLLCCILSQLLSGVCSVWRDKITREGKLAGHRDTAGGFLSRALFDYHFSL